MPACSNRMRPPHALEVPKILERLRGGLAIVVGPAVSERPAVVVQGADEV